MELTPIRVRGKRRAGDQLLVAPPPKRAHKDRSQKKQAGVCRPKVSYLEKSLPLEILERIFWLSENVNFPRASPRLGRLLSGPSTLRETFLSAFGPTWEVWFGCVDGRDASGYFPVVHSYAGWDEDVDRFGGNPGFQTDLLACSWTTIDMILDCRDIWVRRHARNLPFEHIPLWLNMHSPQLRIYSGTANTSNDAEGAKSYFRHDYEAFRQIGNNPDYYNDWLDPAERHDSTWIDVHRSTQIPDDLITGPWDESSLQKLFWLVQAGARLSSSQTWEVTCEGFSNAMSDRYAPNMTVIRLLHMLGAFENWPEHVISHELRNVDDTMHAASHVLKKEDAITLVMRYRYLRMVLKFRSR
ncbi:hypothetical protein F5Y09DRAFT_190266 [Xylaria sp. FL1042]|nr:hypothetical protein F5Y09DRAFT_190266 [Xylaria sp. FL1042]